MDRRPIHYNKNGQYNLDFIDWNNEWERVGEIMNKIENGEPVSDEEEEKRVRRYMELNELENGVVWQNYPIVPKNQIPINKECYICLQVFTKKKIIRKLPCGHMFCEMCLKPWLEKNSTCPTCKYELKPKSDDGEEDEPGVNDEDFI